MAEPMTTEQVRAAIGRLNAAALDTTAEVMLDSIALPIAEQRDALAAEVARLREEVATARREGAEAFRARVVERLRREAAEKMATANSTVETLRLVRLQVAATKRAVADDVAAMEVSDG